MQTDTSPSIDSNMDIALNRQHNNNTTLSLSPPVADQHNSEMKNYLQIIHRNIVSNNFHLNKTKHGANTKSRIDDIERMPKHLAPAILTPVRYASKAADKSHMMKTATNSSGFSKNILNVTNASALTNKSVAQKTQNFFPMQQF